MVRRGSAVRVRQRALESHKIPAKRGCLLSGPKQQSTSYVRRGLTVEAARHQTKNGLNRRLWNQGQPAGRLSAWLVIGLGDTRTEFTRPTPRTARPQSRWSCGVPAPAAMPGCDRLVNLKLLFSTTRPSYGGRSPVASARSPVGTQTALGKRFLSRSGEDHGATGPPAARRRRRRRRRAWRRSRGGARRARSSSLGRLATSTISWPGSRRPR